jgi:Rrf2 family protein
MAHLTASVEYGLHSLLWMVGAGEDPLSSRDLAEFQNLSPTFLAKILAKLEKAGILTATGGVRGGYVLARAAEEISFLEVVDAIEGRKPLFDCQDIRGGCALFGETPPDWATRGVCSVHAAILRAEKAMRESLASQSLADLGQAVARQAPAEFEGEVQAWLGDRVRERGRGKGRKETLQ